jgi:tripartite-type tricarboxylate transporter receptor subunit TctC
MLTDIGNFSNAPNVYKLSFDIFKDFAPITIVSYTPHLLTTHPSVPVRNAAELIALAKKNPGKLKIPTGIGTAPHFAAMASAVMNALRAGGVVHLDMPMTSGTIWHALRQARAAATRSR